MKDFRTPDPAAAWDLNAVQVRILTIDAEGVVQRTVDAIPPELDDILVIAETDIEIDGAEVLVVPDDFESEATNKGRAVEWARQEHPTDREYILYLDEDTIIPDLEAIPAADIVQFRERPTRTGSLVSYLAEIHRIGFNVEQKEFDHLRIPLYAWGGGIAIRTEIEHEITWDVETIIEDSVFVWRAILEADASFHVTDVFFENQAPPSIKAMIRQRRRWLTGTRMQRDLLPFDYRLLYAIRDTGWAVSAFAPVIWLLSLIQYAGVLPFSMKVVLLPEVYFPLAFTLLGFVYLWSLIGFVHCRERPIIAVLLVLFTPFVVMVHSLGALYGRVWPTKKFAVTEKVIHDDAGGRAERTETEPVPKQTAEDRPFSDLFDS